MSTFTNKNTGVRVTVDDSKDDRFGADWEKATSTKAPAKRAAAKS